ncbi:MAG: type III pantothenate kinase [Betaproteobacteria bacterium]|nr:type III pantothenate kinase [Betaproteobacteria bacterium]
MIVAIDAGNTRIKWGVHDGTRWTDKGALPTADAVLLSETADEWPAGVRVVMCNVAGAAVGQKVVALLAERRAKITVLHASEAACGVRNAYEQPGQLGADRWAALIGARGRIAGACLVVCAGTATTADLLDATGQFRGGVILPGFDLMRASLAQNTAQLPLGVPGVPGEGEFRSAPRNTMDAIFSGCLHAQAGAIERMFAMIAGEPGAKCLLTGGGARSLAPHLSIPRELADNLILDGLVRFAVSL